MKKGKKEKERLLEKERKEKEEKLYEGKPNRGGKA